jgi:peptide/nickel transport system substrate-binding protein
MTPTYKRLAALAVAALAATGLAACSKSSTTGTTAPTGGPVFGGTLHIVAASGQDHFDPVSAYATWDYIVERAYTRQLLSYPTVPTTTTSGPAWLKATTPEPDIATVVPTTTNGGITDGGLTYTFHIKPGVMWNTKPARQVTSADFLREFKAFGNPVSPVGNSGYYASTIKGMKQYLAAETAFFSAKNAPAGTAANIAEFQNTHQIPGISTPNSSTLVFHLVQPATDFENMLAMPFASARPVEYDSYVPDSAQFRQHTLSDGPYQISSYVPGKSVTLTRNPAWKQSTDTLRHQYVSSIVISMGTSSATTQVDDMKAGTQDLVLDTPFPPTLIPEMQSSNNADFHIWPWSNTNPYLAFNLQSPDANGAMKKLLVRQAMEYATDKSQVQRYFGGPALSKIINTMIPPGNVGYENFNLYPTANNAGDPAKCKALLAQAGYKHGLSLTDLYLNDSVNTGLFQVIAGDFASCGITLHGHGEPISQYFVSLGNAPSNNKPNVWDVAQPAWIPDWFGNNGRTTMQPFYQTDCELNTINYGCFSSSKVDTDITSALSATSTSAAGNFWHLVDLTGMQQAVYVPLLDQFQPQFSSSRVHNAGSQWMIFNPTIGGPDITNIWVSK